MRSFPLIHSVASETEQAFNRFVERRIDGCDGLYEAEGHSQLPGDTLRVAVNAADVADQRHSVEFMSLGGDGHWQAVGSIRHLTKGGNQQVESTFEIVLPGLPRGHFSWAEVEPVVQRALNEMGRLRLTPLPFGRRLRCPEVVLG